VNHGLDTRLTFSMSTLTSSFERCLARSMAFGDFSGKTNISRPSTCPDPDQITHPLPLQRARETQSEAMLEDIDVLVFDMQDVWLPHLHVCLYDGELHDCCPQVWPTSNCLRPPNPINGQDRRRKCMESGACVLLLAICNPHEHGMTLASWRDVFNEPFELNLRPGKL